MPIEGTLQERFPEIFFQTNIDRHGRKRTKPMKVLVIGLQRTGTMSMRAALRELGIGPVYHMIEVMKNPPDADTWVSAFEAKYKGKGQPYTRKEWDQLLADFEATIDLPAASFMPELIAAYPEAKVIVSEREAQAWLKSVQASIGKFSRGGNILFFILRSLDTAFLRRWLPMADWCTRGAWGQAGYEDKEHAIKVYKELHEEVRRLVPKESGRLLEYKLGMGWEPLCEFLGTEVPSKPFPKINESAEFEERMQLIIKMAMIRVAKQYMPFVGVVAVTVGAWYWMM